MEEQDQIRIEFQKNSSFGNRILFFTDRVSGLARIRRMFNMLKNSKSGQIDFSSEKFIEMPVNLQLKIYRSNTGATNVVKERTADGKCFLEWELGFEQIVDCEEKVYALIETGEIDTHQYLLKDSNRISVLVAFGKD